MRSFQPFWDETTTAINVVFGAILGAYIGVSLSEYESQNVDPLFPFFISLYVFVLCIISAGNRVHQDAWRMAAGYTVGTILFTYLSFRTAVAAGFNANMIGLILTCWIIAVLFEVITSAFATLLRRFSARNTDVRKLDE